MSVILLALVFGGGVIYQRTTGFEHGVAFWRTWCAVSGAEPDFSEDPWRAKTLVIFMTIVQTFFFAFLLSVVETALTAKLDELAAGRTRVVETNHEVILGWNPSLPRVLQQMRMSTDSNRERRTVAILSPLEKDEMDRVVSETLARGDGAPRGGGLRVICRSGDPSDPDDQLLVSTPAASRVLVLSTKRGQGSVYDTQVPPALADNVVFKTALALKNRGKTNAQRTILETFDAKNADLVPFLGKLVTRLNWSSLVTKQLVQCAVEGKGLAEVQSELTSFEGNELYLEKFGGVEGEDFGAVADRMSGGVAIGVVRDKEKQKLVSDVEVILNPTPSMQILKDDKIVFLAADKPSVSVVAKATKSEKASSTTAAKVADEEEVLVAQQKELGKKDRERQKKQQQPSRLLVLGWRAGMRSMLEEIDRYYAKGSRVTLLSSASMEMRKAEFGALKNVRLEHVVSDMSDMEAISAWRRGAIGAGVMDNEEDGRAALMVLLDESCGASSVNQREARVLETLVAVKAAFADELDKSRNTDTAMPTVVCELETTSTEQLVASEAPFASVLTIDDFSSSLIAQAAYHPDILPVWEMLLSSKGTDIRMRPPSALYDVVEVLDASSSPSSSGPAPTYDELRRLCRINGETLLGFTRADGKSTVVFGPDVSPHEPLPRSSIERLMVLTDRL